MAAHEFKKERLEELMPIMQAWLEGKKLQWQRHGQWDGQWEDVIGSPYWEDGVTYRVAPEKKVLEGWVNIYPDNPYNQAPAFHKTKEWADENALFTRIACVKCSITYTEGEGL